MFRNRPRIAVSRATGLLLFLIAITACGQLGDTQSTPGATRPQTVTERIIDAVISAAADLNFDESDFPADWNIESFGDGDALLQLLATDSDPSGNAVSALVERFESATAAEQALNDALTALSASETGEPVRLGDRGVIAPDGDGWVAIFRVDNVIARVAADSGGPNATSKAATLNWAERLESRIIDRAERGRAGAADTDRQSGRKAENSRPAIFSSAGAAPGLAIAATAIAEAKVTTPGIEQGHSISSTFSGTETLTSPPVAIAPDQDIDQTSPEIESAEDGDASTSEEPPGASLAPTPAPPAASAPPDLVLSEVSPTPVLANPGQSIAWKVRVENTGHGPSEAFNLNVFAHSTPDGSALLVQEVRMPAIEPGSSFSAVVNRNAIPGEFLTFIAGSDGDEATADENFENNSYTVALGDYMLPDLLIAAHAAEITDASPGQTIDWSVTVRNPGPGDTHDATSVTLIDAATDEVIATAVVPVLARGEEITRTFQVTATVDGLIAFAVDSSALIDEADEDNNATDDISTRTALRPDLTLDSVEPQPANPLPGESVEWVATIGNSGPGDGGSFRFRVLSSIDAGDSATLIHEALLPGIPMGGAVVAKFRRNAQIGETLTFEIEPESGREVSSDNNSATVEMVDIFLPDLEITELEPNRYDVERGQGFSWKITVRNSGGGNPIRVTRVAMIDTNTGSEVGSVRIPLLFAGTEAKVTLDLNSAIVQSLLFRVDPDETIPEADEENNSLSREVADVLLHDLTMDRLAVNAPISEDGIASWQWSITNNGPGRALDITITTTIHLDPTGVQALEPIHLASLKPGETVGGSFKRLAVRGERIVMHASTDPQIESFEFDNTVDVMGSDFF